MELSGKHILIVDDNLKNLQVTAKVLKDSGFNISLAQNGSKGLDSMQKFPPDLILLDIMMPEMNGIEVCNIIQKNEKTKDIPVIFLTAKNQTEDLVEAFKAGGVDYVTKPFNREELLIRVKTHLELAGSRKKIMELVKSRDQLYSIIAHDIRSPFANIRMTIETVNRGYIKTGTEEFRIIIEQLYNSVNETSMLLDNLLHWTRNQAEGFSPAPEDFPVQEMLTDIIEKMKNSSKQKQITLEYEVDKALTIHSDKNMLHTILRNLVSNAIKFTPENGKIILRAEQDNKHTEIRVQDSGVGIPEDIIDNILNEKSIYSTPGTKGEAGTGFGLTIVKDFITKLNGTLSIESTPKKGSTFKINLPIA